MQVTRFIILIIITLSSIGCAHYRYNGKSNFVFSDQYFKSDTLYLGSYHVVNTLADIRGRTHRYYENDKLDKDSVLQIFYSSLQKSPDISVNLIDKSSTEHLNFIRKGKLRYEYVDREELINLNKDVHKTIIFPTISITDRLDINRSDGGSYQVIFLTIMIHVIKNNEIIYTKSQFTTASSDYFAEGLGETYEEFKIYLKQDIWDSLIEQIMKEYIDKLK